MKTDIHPDYQAVVFRDLGSGETFLTRSTVTSDKTIELDGVEYPVIDVEISSASHPFYTGKQRIMDSAGRVEKFNQRFKNFGGAPSKLPRLDGARRPVTGPPRIRRPRFGGAFLRLAPLSGSASCRRAAPRDRAGRCWMKYSVRLSACARAQPIWRVWSSSDGVGQPRCEALGERLRDPAGGDRVGGRLVGAVEPHGVVRGDDLERALALAPAVVRLVDDERVDDRATARWIGATPWRSASYLSSEKSYGAL